MNIGLDFDKTYTLDPVFWDEFVSLARRKGHEVYCVTSREDNPKNRSEVQVGGVTVIFCGFASKLWHTKHTLNLVIDVWVDDDPEMCCAGKGESVAIVRKSPKAGSQWRRGLPRSM